MTIKDHNNKFRALIVETLASVSAELAEFSAEYSDNEILSFDSIADAVDSISASFEGWKESQ